MLGDLEQQAALVEGFLLLVLCHVAPSLVGPGTDPDRWDSTSAAHGLEGQD
jgi:hypothetical protein